MKKPPFTQPIFSNTEPEPVVSKKAKEGLWQSGDGIRLSPIQKAAGYLRSSADELSPRIVFGAGTPSGLETSSQSDTDSMGSVSRRHSPVSFCSASSETSSDTVSIMGRYSPCSDLVFQDAADVSQILLKPVGRRPLLEVKRPLLLLEANAGNLDESTLFELSLEHELVLTPVTLQELAAVSCKSAESERDGLCKDISDAIKMEKSQLVQIAPELRSDLMLKISQQLNSLNDARYAKFITRTKGLLKDISDSGALGCYSPEPSMRNGFMAQRLRLFNTSSYHSKKVKDRLKILSYARVINDLGAVNWRMPITLSDDKISLDKLKAIHPEPGRGLLLFVTDRVRLLKNYDLQQKGPMDSAIVQKQQEEVLQKMFDQIRADQAENISRQLEEFKDKKQTVDAGVDRLGQQIKSLQEQMKQQKALSNQIKAMTPLLHKAREEQTELAKKIRICEELLRQDQVAVKVSRAIRGQVLVGGQKCSSKYDLNDLYQCMAAKLMGASLLSSNKGIKGQIDENPYLSILISDIKIISTEDTERMSLAF